MNPTRCRHLRHKQMYVAASSDAVPDDQAIASGSARHYWCNRTLTETGPDDRPVRAELCCDARACCEG